MKATSSLMSTLLATAFLAGMSARDCLAQQPSQESAPQQSSAPQEASDQPPETESKRIFGIIPNYRTSPTLKDYMPLTPKEKWTIAAEDSFDRGTFVLAAAFGAQGQLFDSNPSFGHGLKGYSRYYAASFADWVAGDVMTEAVFPIILRQDPRYFRRGEGGGRSRLEYSVGQIFWTHTDSSGTGFNYSEIVGNAAAVALSNLYYRDNRTVGNALSKLAVQVGVDMAANILKEFSPDFARAVARKPRKKSQSQPDASGK
jgi:hypothetical protein